jgi:hypothetical protein
VSDFAQNEERMGQTKKLTGIVTLGLEKQEYISISSK